MMRSLKLLPRRTHELPAHPQQSQHNAVVSIEVPFFFPSISTSFVGDDYVS